MDALERFLEAALNDLERNLATTVVHEEGELQYFEDHAIEHVEDFRDALTEELSAHLPEMLRAKEDPYQLSPLLTASTILEFTAAFEPSKANFPLVYEFIETLDTWNIEYGPLSEAIRNYFTLEKISAIEDEFTFRIAATAFIHISEIDFQYSSQFSHDWIIPILDRLQTSPLASPEDRKKIEKVLSIYEGSSEISVQAAPVEFSKSTGGLEYEFLEWLHTFLGEDDLFSDDFDLLDDKPDRDPDLELIITQWLAHESPSTDADPLNTWRPAETKIPIDFDYEGKPIIFEIHLISTDSYDPLLLKVTLFRTGERHEYDSEMDRSFLALQVAMLMQNENIEYSAIEGEICWLRLNERDYPLKGLEEQQLEEMAQKYLDAQ